MFLTSPPKKKKKKRKRRSCLPLPSWITRSLSPPPPPDFRSFLTTVVPTQTSTCTSCKDTRYYRSAFRPLALLRCPRRTMQQKL